MTRSEAREQAFVLVFESSFYESPDVAEIIDNAVLGRELEVNEFSRRLAGSTIEHLEEIDALIEQYLRGWSKKRISRVALAALRLAVNELLYEEAVPQSVSINEAVELTKKYSTKEDSSFVNGVLGSLVREREKGGEL